MTRSPVSLVARTMLLLLGGPSQRRILRAGGRDFATRSGPSSGGLRDRSIISAIFAAGGHVTGVISEALAD